MPNLSIGSSAYKRTDAQVPEARVENYYWEKSAVTPNGEMWMPRPGLDLFRAGVGALRGLFRAPGCLSGDLIAVIGSSVFRINDVGVATNIGTVSGSERVIIAGNLAGIMVADGTSLQYSTGGAMVTCSITFTNPIWVGHTAGYWLCVEGGSQRRFYTPDTAPTVWDGNFDSASSSTDRLLGCAIISGRIWDFGERSVEFRYASGDADAPFAVEVGRSYERGCLSRDTIVALDNTAIWVGDDRIIYRGADVPQAISDNFIAERLAEVDITDVYAWGFPWQGHVFYCITIGDQGTFVYDLTTDRWAKWLTYGQDKWLPGLGCIGWDNFPLVGDTVSGSIYTLSASKFTDDGQPIVGVLTFGQALSGQRPTFPSLTIEMVTGYATETGQGSDPLIQVRFSRDGGIVYGPWRQTSIGLQGEYNKRVRFNRIGQFKPPGIIGEMSISDPVPRRVSGVYVGEAF
jgi:hypothetical protein